MRASRGTRFWKYSLHIGALASLSVAQPIFDLLSRQPEYLVARHAGLLDVAFLIFLLILLVPASVAAGAYFLGWALGGIRWIQAAGVGLFGFLLGLLGLKTLMWDLGVSLVAAVGLLACLSALVYARFSTARLFLTFLSPAMVIVPALFLTDPTVQKVLDPNQPQGTALESGKTDTPIVMVVFDELPLQSLLDRRGEIDSVRFPNFSGLANGATWFRKTTTVSPSTQYAVAAMTTGNLPQPDRTVLPALADYPDNLFTWLRNSHRLNVSESTTHLCFDCPGSARDHLQRWVQLLVDVSLLYLNLVLPEDLTSGLPDIRYGWTWQLGHPVRQFEAFLESIPEPGKPGLHFIHIQIPHLPWVYLPSGKRYLFGGDMGLFTKRDIWTRDETLVTLAYQRHLLQVGFADRLLGHLLRKLKTHDLYDRSLIVVASDHGVSFQPGGSRRTMTDANFRNILNVPLLIKAPHQKEGRVSDRPTRTTDILPSVAGILGVPAPWPTDGIPVAETEPPENRDLASTALNIARPFEFLRSRTTVCLGGRAFEVTQSGARTHLDGVRESGNAIVFFGWAADMETREPADSILVFINDELVYRGMARHPRPDVGEYFKAAELENSGFLLELDRQIFEGSPRVRCFASFGDRIREAQYPASFPWPVQSEDDWEAARASDVGRICSLDQNAQRSFLITQSLSPETLRKTSEPSEFEIRVQQLAWDAGADGLFQPGPFRALIGKRLDQLTVRPTPGLQIELDKPSLLPSMRRRLDPDFIPAAVEGRVSTKYAEILAVAVNGTVRAVASTFDGPRGDRRFQAIVPESSLLEETNRIQVFAVGQTNGDVILFSSAEGN